MLYALCPSPRNTQLATRTPAYSSCSSSKPA
jgi:hypothetical protein